MKNEEIKLLGVDIKDIIAILAVVTEPNGRLVDHMRRSFPELLDCTDDEIIAVLYATFSAKHKGNLSAYVQNTLLYKNPDFLGYTDDDFVLVRYNGEVEKLSLAAYIDRLKVNSTQK